MSYICTCIPGKPKEIPLPQCSWCSLVTSRTPDKIQPGDVFVRIWGKKELVYLMLPIGSNTAKQPYLRLHTGGVDSTWCHTRTAYAAGNWRRVITHHYKGTVPEWFLKQLMEEAGIDG